MFRGPPKAGGSYALGGWSIAGITIVSVRNPVHRPEWPRSQQRRSDRYRPPRHRQPGGSVVQPRRRRRGAAQPAIETRTRDACVTPSEVRWVQAPVGSLPNASTVGRNTLLTGGTNNFDLSAVQVLPDRRAASGWSFAGRLSMPSTIRSLRKSPSGMSSARSARRADFHRAF